jgi:hypothetical protein
LPAQSFSGSSPLGLETIFYGLRFETSLFVASYDSQGHGEGIRPHLLVSSLDLTPTGYETLLATAHFFVFAVVIEICLSLLCEQSLPIRCNGNVSVRVA